MKTYVFSFSFHGKGRLLNKKNEYNVDVNMKIIDFFSRVVMVYFAGVLLGISEIKLLNS